MNIKEMERAENKIKAFINQVKKGMKKVHSDKNTKQLFLRLINTNWNAPKDKIIRLSYSEDCK